jgi:hypothetical protein
MRKTMHWIAPLLAVVSTSLASAAVKIELDRDSLSQMVAALAPTEVRVPIAGGATLRLELHDVRVTGLEPATAQKPGDGLRIAARVTAPDVGFESSVTPRLTVGLAAAGGESVIELKFEDLALSIPLMGRIDLGRLVAPMRYPAQNAFALPSGDRDVPMVSRLSKIAMTKDALRIEGDVRAATR